MTKQNATYEAIDARTDKEELQKRNDFGTVSRKSRGWLKLDLLVRALTLNSDAAPNYKYRDQTWFFIH